MAHTDTRYKKLVAPACPNNSRHGLTWDSRGGHTCEPCSEELTGTKSRLATRWAFATLPLDTKSEI